MPSQFNPAVNSGPIKRMEKLTSKFATANTLAGAGFTIPANTARIALQPSAACHYTVRGTATATFSKAVAANEVFILEPGQHTASIIGDAGAIDVIVAYMK